MNAAGKLRLVNVAGGGAVRVETANVRSASGARVAGRRQRRRDHLLLADQPAAGRRPGAHRRRRAADRRPRAVHAPRRRADERPAGDAALCRQRRPAGARSGPLRRARQWRDPDRDRRPARRTAVGRSHHRPSRPGQRNGRARVSGWRSDRAAYRVSFATPAARRACSSGGPSFRSARSGRRSCSASPTAISRCVPSPAIWRSMGASARRPLPRGPRAAHWSARAASNSPTSPRGSAIPRRRSCSTPGDLAGHLQGKRHKRHLCPRRRHHRPGPDQADRGRRPLALLSQSADGERRRDRQRHRLARAALLSAALDRSDLLARRATTFAPAARFAIRAPARWSPTSPFATISATAPAMRRSTCPACASRRTACSRR